MKSRSAKNRGGFFIYYPENISSLVLETVLYPGYRQEMDLNRFGCNFSTFLPTPFPKIQWPYLNFPGLNNSRQYYNMVSSYRTLHVAIFSENNQAAAYRFYFFPSAGMPIFRNYRHW